MDRVQVKVKRLPGQEDMVLPAYETDGAAGMDIRAAVKDPVTINPGEIRLVPTGLTVAIPRGYEAQIRARSGLALKNGIGVVNAPGTIDSDYRGEIGLIMINWGQESFTINRGDRVGQMLIHKVHRAEFIEVEELDGTERGVGGFGHSGVD